MVISIATAVIGQLPGGVPPRGCGAYSATWLADCQPASLMRFDGADARHGVVAHQFYACCWTGIGYSTRYAKYSVYQQQQGFNSTTLIVPILRKTA